MANEKSCQFNLNYYAVILESHIEPDKEQLYKDAKEHNIEAFYIKKSFKLEHIEILAVDMDSTLINIECIDEIANLAGVKEQVSEITKATMQGKITNFSDSLKQRVAFLKNINISLLDNIYNDCLKLSDGVENLLEYMHKKDVHTMLLSGGFTFFSDKLKSRLNLKEAYSNKLSVKDNMLTGEVEGEIIDGNMKAKLLQTTMDNKNLNLDNVISIGDGANDLPMMEISGFSVAYKAKPIVTRQASMSINKLGLDVIILLP